MKAFGSYVKTLEQLYLDVTRRGSSAPLLGNISAADVAELRQQVWDALVALKHQPQLLTSFIRHARVPLLLKA